MNLRISLTLIQAVLLLNFAYAGDSPGMRVIEINDHMLAFYDGRDPNFEPYCEVYQENLKAVHDFYKEKPLPDLNEK